ncbi:hypothetical protein Tco_1209607 [Tanacetum coccineum]
MPKSAWTEKDHIDNFLKEKRLMRSLEKFIGGRLNEGGLRYKVVRHRYSNLMIQPEPNGSTQGYPLDSVEVLRYDTKGENVRIRKSADWDGASIGTNPIRFYTLSGNHVKEILLKLNLLDHRILKDGGEGTWFQLTYRFIATCSYLTDNIKTSWKAPSTCFRFNTMIHIFSPDRAALDRGRVRCVFRVICGFLRTFFGGYASGAAISWYFVRLGYEHLGFVVCNGLLFGLMLFALLDSCMLRMICNDLLRMAVSLGDDNLC